jgi:hypothetical protein
VDALVLDVLAALGHFCLRARSAPSPGSMTADAGRGAGKGGKGKGTPFLVPRGGRPLFFPILIHVFSDWERMHGLSTVRGFLFCGSI